MGLRTLPTDCCGSRGSLFILLNRGSDSVSTGFQSICMRASQVGIHSSPDQVNRAREILDSRRLGVSMILGDFDIVYDNERGPNCLRNITPYLDLAEQLGSSMIRICLK